MSMISILNILLCIIKVIAKLRRRREVMGIKEVIKKIFHTGEDKTEYKTEMNNVENMRSYIKQQLR